MIPNDITRDDVLRAIEKIRRKGVPPRRESRDKYLVFKNELFPPKYVISIANEFANGEELRSSDFITTEAIAFLKRLGFKIKEEKDYNIPSSAKVKGLDNIMKSISIPNQEDFRRGVEEFEKHEKRDAMYKVATYLVKYFWGSPADMTDGLGVLLLTWNQAFYRYGIFDFDKLEKCITDNFQNIENFRNRDISSLSDNDSNNIKYLFDQFSETLQIDSMRFSDRNKKKYTKKHLEELLSKWNIGYDSSNLKAIYASIKDDPKIKDAIEFIEGDEIGSKKAYIQITISRLRDMERNILESTKLIMKSPVSVAKALHLLAPKFFPLWDDKISRAYGCYYSTKPAEKYVLFCKITQVIADKVRNYIIRSDRTLIKLIDEYNYSKYTQRWI